MTYQEIFDKLWELHSNQNPSAKAIRNLFIQQGEDVENDHIAYRTFSDKRVNIEVLAKPFENVGYKPVATYHFKEKKLRAVHFENPEIKNAPRVFISELKLDECSEFIQNSVSDLLNNCKQSLFNKEDLILSQAIWGRVSYNTYLKIREESEYAAWLYVYGFRPNHFTVSINSLKKIDSIQELNQFIKDNGYILNSSGGEIKGSPESLLEQSSTMADIIEVEFIEGIYKIPACYYEFAKRYPDEEGKLFSGFIASSADKIFESTDFYKK